MKKGSESDEQQEKLSPFHRTWAEQRICFQRRRSHLSVTVQTVRTIFFTATLTHRTSEPTCRRFPYCASTWDSGIKDERAHERAQLSALSPIHEPRVSLIAVHRTIERLTWPAVGVSWLTGHGMLACLSARSTVHPSRLPEVIRRVILRSKQTERRGSKFCEELLAAFII
jgi:hypothetical protein